MHCPIFFVDTAAERAPHLGCFTDDYAPTDYLVHNLIHAIYPGQRSVQ